MFYLFLKDLLKKSHSNLINYITKDYMKSKINYLGCC